MSSDKWTLEQYIENYAKTHTKGDIEEAKKHRVVKDVTAMYDERKTSLKETAAQGRRPVRMDNRCDS